MRHSLTKTLSQMKKILRTTLSFLLASGIFLSLGAGVVLFMIKHEVMSFEMTIKNISKSLMQIEQEIVILTSEWTYLTRPERIEKLLHHLKGFSALDACQIVKKV